MYTAHFGLADPPFSLTPDPRFVYMSERHREALAHLLYGISQGEGFVQLTGDVGTGKTTVCRCLLDQVPPGVDVALILNPRLTSAELLSTLCDELRVAYPVGTTSVKALVDALYQYLLDAHQRGRRTVLIVDEAQNLTPDVLEQLRLLTNLETTREKLLQIVLIGQPELVVLLERPGLRQVAQRVTVRYHLRPFSAGDTRVYVRHRLRVAGRHEPVFTDRALHQVHRFSGGVPRLINVVCDRALLGAFSADLRQVDARMVRRAAREVRGSARSGRPSRFWRWAAVGLAVVALGWGGVLLTPHSLVQLGSRPVQHAEVSVATDATPLAIRAGATVPVSAARPPVAPGADLAELLADSTLRADRQEAFARLLNRWGHDYQGGLACQYASTAQLRCLVRTGGWGRLRRFNLPAVIELTAPAGDKRYAVVTTLGEGTATLEFGGRQVVLPLGAVDAFWDGTFVLLWKAPPVSVLPMMLGQRGPSVEWLRARLDEIDGSSSVASGDVFDPRLLERVKAFQRSQFLTPDGLVGEETVARLVAENTDLRPPRLAAP